MIDYGNIYKAVRKAIHGTGLEQKAIRKGFFNAPKSADYPFAVYTTPSIRKINRDSIYQEDLIPLDINLEKIGNRQIDIDVNFFGKDSISRAEEMIHILQSNSYQDFIVPLKVAYVDCSDVQDLTDLEMGKYEERALITITFAVYSKSAEFVREIAEIEIGAAIISSQNNVRKTNIHIKKETL